MSHQQLELEKKFLYYRVVIFIYLISKKKFSHHQQLELVYLKKKVLYYRVVIFIYLISKKKFMSNQQLELEKKFLYLGYS